MNVSTAADAQQVENQVVARVPCAAGARLQFSWGLGAELRLCEIQHPVSKSGGVEAAQSNVVWSAPSASHKALSFAVAPHQAKLIQGSCGGKDADASGLVALEHAVWQLLEMFYVKDMARWLEDNEGVICRHLGTRSLQERLNDAMESVRPDVLEDYWPCLQSLVAVGRSEDALSLLAAHDAMKMQQQCDIPTAMLPQGILAAAAAGILAAAAAAGILAAAAAGILAAAAAAGILATAVRASWQQQCRDLPTQCADLFQGCADINDKTATGVLAILSVLGGDEGHVAESASNWLDLLVSELVHQHPNVKAQQHLHSLMHRCLQVHPIDAEGKDQVLELMFNLMEAMVESEVQRVVEVLSSSGAVSPFFMAHMYELMYTSSSNARLGMSVSVIERPLPLFGGDQVEYWRLLFAETLMSHPSTWKLALDYLAWCPLHGADAAESFLEALPYGSENTQLVHRALHQCTEHNLSATANSICRTAGCCAWYQGRIGEAVRWFARARDERRLAGALEPAMLQIEAALVSNVGNYQARALTADNYGDLATLLETVITSSSETCKEGSATAVPTTASFLLAFVKLQRAIQGSIHTQSDELQRAIQGSIHTQSDEALAGTSDARLAYAGVRDNFMDLVNHNAVPKRLVPSLLFSIIPFLEADGCMPFTSADVQSLTRWLSSCLAVPDPLVAKSSVSTPLHARHIKDSTAVSIEIIESRRASGREIERSQISIFGGCKIQV
eukprot:gene23077-30269_t